VRDRIQTLLGGGRHDSQLRAEGTIIRADKRFRLDLVVRVRDLVGTRRLESNSCEGLAGAAAVELGLMIHSAEAALETNRPGTPSEPLQTVRGAGPSGVHDGTDARQSQGTNDASPAGPVPDSTKFQKDTEVTKETEEPPPRIESQRTWHALVQVPVVELSVGPLPQPTRGVGLAVGLEHDHWQLQLKGLSWQRQSVSAPGFPGYGADVDRTGAAFWGCREFRSSWFAISPCITAGMERVSATGTGRNIVQSTEHAFEMTIGAGAQGRAYLASWLRLLVTAGGQIQLGRPKIAVAGGKPADNLQAYQFEVYQFAPAALAVGVGLEWAL